MSRFKKGLTLIEILIVMAVFAIIFGFTSINLLRPQQKANVESTAITVVADIKEQQAKAMASDSEGTGDSQNHGIFFENSRYTLFQGSAYNPVDPSNFTINLNSNLILLNNLPSSQIVFSKNNGLWSDFNDITKRIVVKNHNPSDPIPPPPTGPTCQDADVNKDGRVDVPNDILPIILNAPPDPYDAIYDVSKDGLIDTTDSGLAISFFGPCPILVNPEQKTITVNQYGGIYIN